VAEGVETIEQMNFLREGGRLAVTGRQATLAL